LFRLISDSPALVVGLFVLAVVFGETARFFWAILLFPGSAGPVCAYIQLRCLMLGLSRRAPRFRVLSGEADQDSRLRKRVKTKDWSPAPI
jgi:hypothetical protein